METKDDRMLREAEELAEQKKKADFLSKTIELLDSSFQVRADRSIYVYLERGMEDGTADKLWYVFNDGCVYYSIYEDLHSLMLYINEGNCDEGNRYLDLTEEEFEIVEGN